MKTVLKYAGLFSAAFLISGGLAYYAIGLFTQSAKEIILPELRGKNVIYVLETLTNMGLNAKLYGTDFNDTIPRYAVISQDPMPGTTIKKGRDVIIYLSKGKKQNIVPDTRQLPLKQALILIEKNEFKKGHISIAYSTKAVKGSVISQYPKPFSTALKQSACNLLVSRGEAPKKLVMPKLSGLDAEKAARKLADKNLSVSKILSRRDIRKPWGVVLSHTPEPGSRVEENTQVTLVVNHTEENRQMDPDRLADAVFITHNLTLGFLNRHVRVETDLFGPATDLYNEYMKPGEQLNILIPANVKTAVNIFIDHRLVKAITIDPWKKDSITGDDLWELSPLQFYQQTSPAWERN